MTIEIKEQTIVKRTIFFYQTCKQDNKQEIFK